MLFAVQPLLLPPPAPIDSTLIDTPQTLAAMLIGICALIGMFALSMCRSSARLLSTFDRLTLTSDGTALAALETPDATAEPALFTPLTAEFAVLHPPIKADARTSVVNAVVLRMLQSLCCAPNARSRRMFQR